VSSLLSLASPHVILAEYGALTLALQSTKISDGYQMVIQRRSSLRCSKCTRRGFPQSTVPVEYGDLKRRYRIVSAMLCNSCKPCCNYLSIYNKALFFDNFYICRYMCRVDILGTHIVSAWSSLGNRVLHLVLDN
jgi:hypothetical protein